MCCFIAPATTAIVTTSLKKKIPSKYRLEWLNTMLWGGVAMLIIEHISHGEIVPFPPFITAMKSPSDTAVMLQEIATIGTSMTVAIIMAWAGLVFVVNKTEKTKSKTQVAGV
jgi:hypothetical protein